MTPNHLNSKYKFESGETLGPEQARALALSAQGLLAARRGRAGLAELIGQLGYIQIDAISVIERAHHHVLWSRASGYQPAWLDQLLEAREVFEYWGHAASYLPFADFRFYLPLMQSFLSRSRWASRQQETHGHLIPELLARIAAEGPLSARHFEHQKRPGAGWWSWKPAKIALELLYWQGRIMVSRREGFEKVYDLAERVIPPGTDLRHPDPDELARFCLLKALQAHGVLNLKEIAKHLPLSPPERLKAALEEALAAGEVLAVRIHSLAGSFYALASTLARPLPKVPRRVLLLSPFDNLVIQRSRFKALFGGDYQFEAYVPASKRRYGYFSLPLLLGDELLGYLDCKAYRDRQELEIRQATWLRSLKTAESRAVSEQLARFARFNGCRLSATGISQA